MEGPRVILRNWRQGDEEELFRHAGNPALGKAAGWEPHQSLEQSRQLLSTIFGGAETYAIVLKSTGLPVGNIELMFATDFHTAPLTPHEAEISYWIGQDYWGQGLVPEAAQLLIHHSFQNLHLTGLWCCHYHGNLQSKRVQEKCGFHYHHCNENGSTKTGEPKRVHLLHLSREQWLDSHP